MKSSQTREKESVTSREKELNEKTKDLRRYEVLFGNSKIVIRSALNRAGRVEVQKKMRKKKRAEAVSKRRRTGGDRSNQKPSASLFTSTDVRFKSNFKQFRKPNGNVSPGNESSSSTRGQSSTSPSPGSRWNHSKILTPDFRQRSTYYSSFACQYSTPDYRHRQSYYASPEYQYSTPDYRYQHRYHTSSSFRSNRGPNANAPRDDYGRSSYNSYRTRSNNYEYSGGYSSTGCGFEYYSSSYQHSYGEDHTAWDGYGAYWRYNNDQFTNRPGAESRHNYQKHSSNNQHYSDRGDRAKSSSANSQPRVGGYQSHRKSSPLKSSEEWHYKVLGLGKDATRKEIKQAHRTLVLKYHPDRYKGKDENATEIFRQVQEAYEVLRKVKS